jgi:probable HAF family extracellular repeat protein
MEAFRWTADVMTGLGVLPGELRSAAFGVSADGAVVVGSSGGSDPDQAFRWAGGVMSGIGFLPGGAYSYASAVSADGATIVGQSKNASGAYEAFQWADSVMTGLGKLPGDSDSTALAVSGDGSVVVGTSGTADSTGAVAGQAFAKTASKGMERLADVLTASGATIPAGWTLTAATGISSDGVWIVGNGLDPAGNHEAFIANIAPGATLTPSGGGASGGGGALDELSLIALGLAGLAGRKLKYR